MPVPADADMLTTIEYWAFRLALLIVFIARIVRHVILELIALRTRCGNGTQRTLLMMRSSLLLRRETELSAGRINFARHDERRCNLLPCSISSVISGKRLILKLS